MQGRRKAQIRQEMMRTLENFCWTIHYWYPKTNLEDLWYIFGRLNLPKLIPIHSGTKISRYLSNDIFSPKKVHKVEKEVQSTGEPKVAGKKEEMKVIPPNLP